MQEISKSVHHLLGIQWHTITIKAPVGANKMIQRSLVLNVAQYEYYRVGVLSSSRPCKIFMIYVSGDTIQSTSSKAEHVDIYMFFFHTADHALGAKFSRYMCLMTTIQSTFGASLAKLPPRCWRQGKQKSAINITNIHCPPISIE